MRIDRRAESLAREILAGVVSRDADRTAAGLDALAEQGAVADATQLVFAVARTALLRIHDGEVPSERQNREMAALVVGSESWSPVDADEVHAVLETLCDPAHQSNLPPEQLINAIFVVTGYLLASYLTALGYRSWTDFLDHILDTLESAADR
jgi:hypothetical protein